MSNVRIGAIFPQTETSPDPGAIREYAQAVEAAGYKHIGIYDHVLGAAADRPGGWNGPYNSETLFHEVLVLFGYLAALTSSIELCTQILILPQRLTAVVAKQVAELDILSLGRVRLGVGLGWNPVEYEATGQSFRDRGRRIEAQIALMRRLWVEPVIDVHDEFHSISLAGLKPLPGRVIPIWMGGSVEAAQKRIARIADGWIVNMPLQMDPDMVAKMLQLVADAGRDPETFGIDGRVSVTKGVSHAAQRANEWIEKGATHVSVNTMGSGLEWPAGHIAALEALMKELPG